MIKNIQLASFSVSEYNSRGRQFSIPMAKDRNAFQRDYTRLLHSRSFRKLQGKTQVFPAEMGEMHDTYRTRMSHSFEVEQVARSIARFLSVNQDLCAALAIGHDIGHAPFGHLGQDVLNDLFKDVGGFEHNHQALKIVDILESPYPEHQGLNLMFETREGLLKHCNKERASLLGSVAERHLTGQSPSLEVQIVDAADQIAYLHGDLEDAFDKGLFLGVNIRKDIPGFERAWLEIQKEKPHLMFPSHKQLSNQNLYLQEKNAAIVGEVWRKMLSISVNDLMMQSQKNLIDYGIETLTDVRNVIPLIQLSSGQYTINRDLRSFSRKNIYNHERVTSYLKDAEEALRCLYAEACSSPQSFKLPSDLSREKLRDWIAGLTDRSVLSWFSQRTGLNATQPQRLEFKV